MPPRIPSFCAAAALLLAGCATVSPDVEIPVTHPAHPDAVEVEARHTPSLKADEATLHTSELLRSEETSGTQHQHH